MQGGRALCRSESTCAACPSGHLVAAAVILSPAGAVAGSESEIRCQQPPSAPRRLARSPSAATHHPARRRGEIIGSSHRGQPRRQGRGTERAKPLSSAASLQYQMWNLLGNSGRKREDLGIVPAIQMDTCNLQGNGVQNFSVHGQATVVVRALRYRT